MEKLSFSTFGVARFLMALAVFFCHVFYEFNYLGFLFVGVFFFMSGYGMEFTQKRELALTRLIPYILLFGWFSCIYFFFFQVFPYPSSWFLVVYFVVMVLYRFIRNIYFLLWSFCGLALVFMLCGFEFGWSASFGGFLFGVFFARNTSRFTLSNVLFFLPGLYLVHYRVEVALWCAIPFFSWLVFSFCSLRFFRFLAPLGNYSLFFYCIHCFVLGVFGVTWTLGGSPEFWGVLLSFGLSVFLSIFFKDYLFTCSKKVV